MYFIYHHIVDLFHGPSNSSFLKRLKQRKRNRELFGSDSEEEDIVQNKLHKKLREELLDLTESESEEEILQIHVENDLFEGSLTENHTEEKSIESPATTQASEDELLSIKNQLIVPLLLSPLTKTPKRRVNPFRKPEQTNRVENTVRNEKSIREEPQQTSSGIQRNRHQNQYARSCAKNQASSEVAIRGQQSKKTNYLASAIVCVTPKEKCETKTTSNARIATTKSNTQAIIERHNFSEEIRIQTNNESVVSPQLIEKQQNPSDNKIEESRILFLNNKIVPKGVQFAIAVDKNKHYSKNALKKITRNLMKNY